jgi:hypothetical protein
MAINELHPPVRPPPPKPRPPGPSPLRDHGPLWAGAFGAGSALAVYGGARIAQGIGNLIELLSAAAG